MTVLRWIQFLLGGGFLLVGLGLFLFEVFGLFHFKYVLNRMHASAMGDTLGIGASMLGLIILNGFNMVSLKLFLIVVFLWIASPTSSHMIASLEVSTDRDPKRHYREVSLDEAETELKERDDVYRNQNVTEEKIEKIQKVDEIEEQEEK